MKTPLSDGFKLIAIKEALEHQEGRSASSILKYIEDVIEDRLDGPKDVEANLSRREIVLYQFLHPVEKETVVIIAQVKTYGRDGSLEHEEPPYLGTCSIHKIDEATLSVLTALHNPIVIHEMPTVLKARDSYVPFLLEDEGVKALNFKTIEEAEPAALSFLYWFSINQLVHGIEE